MAKRRSKILHLWAGYRDMLGKGNTKSCRTEIQCGSRLLETGSCYFRINLPLALRHWAGGLLQTPQFHLTGKRQSKRRAKKPSFFLYRNEIAFYTPETI